MRLWLVLLLVIPSIVCADDTTANTDSPITTPDVATGTAVNLNIEDSFRANSLPLIFVLKPRSLKIPSSKYVPFSKKRQDIEQGATDAPTDAPLTDAPANTDGPVVASSAGTNAPAGPSSAAPTGPTSAPVTSGPTGSTKAVVPPNDLSVTLGARDVLRDALTLSNTIASLTAQINQLSGELDPSALTTQLQLMAANATAMNTVLNGLPGQIQTLNATEVSMQSNYDTTNNYFSCFAASSCVTDAPPTVSTVTTSPNCNGIAYSTSDTSNWASFSGQSTSLNCSDIITGGNVTNPLTVDLTVTATISGKAFLNVLDGQTSGLIQSFTKTVPGQSISTGKTIVEISYGVLDSSSSITFSVQYKAKNACSLDCGVDGECKLDANGAPFCNCPNACAPPDSQGHCTAPKDCSRTQTRQCGSGTTCVVDTTKDVCYICNPAAKFDWHSITKYFVL